MRKFLFALTVALALCPQGRADSDSSTLVTATGSTAPRTLTDRASDPVNVKDFGAKADGATNDASAIQAAIDAVRPSDGWTPIPRCVYLPRGTYIVNVPIKVYTGTCIQGEGPASVLKASASFTGGAVLLGAIAAGSTHPVAIAGASIKDIGVQGTQKGLWALDFSGVRNIVNIEISNFTFWTAKGLNLSSYLQASIIRRVFSLGPADQMLWVKGNFNLFEMIDKEGATGTTSDPYVLIEGHSAGKSRANHFRFVLIEQVTSANKTLFKADGTDGLTLDDVWLEPTETDGRGLWINDSTGFQIRGQLTHLGTWGKMSVTDHSYGTVEHLSSDGQDIAWNDAMSVDTTSHVDVKQLFSRRTGNHFPLDSLSMRAQVFVDALTLRNPRSDAGAVPFIRPTYAPMENLLVNGSFDQGIDGWPARYDAAHPPSFETVPSEVGQGTMLHVHTFPAGHPSHTYAQQLSIPAAWVGRTMTFSALVKVVGAGYVAPYVEGCGSTGEDSISRVYGGVGWQMISRTFKLASSCTLHVGISSKRTDSTTHLYFDEARLAFGDVSLPGTGQFQDVFIAQKQVTARTAAPTTGTWKLGDIVFNSTPTAGGPMGWMCVAAGSPGTWKAMPSLAP